MPYPDYTPVVMHLVPHLRWLAQTVHQAYHPEQRGPWHTCRRDVCASTVACLARFGLAPDSFTSNEAYPVGRWPGTGPEPEGVKR